jgi:hypothetical protein
MLWPRELIPQNTKRQPQKPTVATSLRYSSTASATNPTANSRKKFTTTPSRALIWSPKCTIKYYSWQTNTSHPTSRAPLGAAGLESPLLKKVRLAQPPLTHPPWLQLRQNGSLIQYQVKKMPPGKCLLIHQEKRNVSTVAARTTRLSIAPLSRLPNAKNLQGWSAFPSEERTSSTELDSSRTNPRTLRLLPHARPLTPIAFTWIVHPASTKSSPRNI